MPDDIQGSQVAQAPAQPQATETPSIPSSSASAPSQQISQAAPQSEYIGISDYARQQGVDLSSLGDDQKIIAHLLSQHQQYPQMQQLARYGSEYLQNYDQYQKWVQSQQQAQVQPQQPRGPWNPPATQEEVQKILARSYVRDPATGEIRPSPTASAADIAKVAEYQQFQSDWQQKIANNPQEAFKPFIENEAKRVVQEMMQVQRVSDNAQAVVQRHANWMFYPNEQGIPIPGQYTPMGWAFKNYAHQAEKMGITNINDQELYALTFLQRDMQQQQLRQFQTPPTQPVQQQRPANPAQRAPALQPAPPSTGTPNVKLNLKDRITRDLVGAGINGFNLEN